MNAPVKYLPTLLPTEHDWKDQSKTNYRRSAELKTIDKAVAACHQAAASDYAKRIGLSNQLLKKIKDWKSTKLVDGQLKSARLNAVENLSLKAEAERQQLQEAQKLRLAQEKFARLRPQEIAIYSAGVLFDNDGNFVGASEAAYISKKADLGGPVDELAIRLALLQDKLDSAYADLEQQPGFKNQTLGLFTVPEWFFKRPGIPFSEDDKLRIQTACQEFSTTRPNMLLLPGSTVWTKDGFAGSELRASASVFFNGEMIHETHKQNMLGDEDGYLQREGYTKKAMKQELQAAWDRAQKTAQDSCFFTLGNRLIALEICGDHKRANQEQQKTSTLAEGADVHILLSKGATLNPAAVTLRNGGIGVANDASLMHGKNGTSLGGARTIFSGGKRVSNSPGALSPFKYHDYATHSINQLDKLNELYMGTYLLPPR